MYVLDEISDIEINSILKQINLNYINNWEQTRQICYMIAVVNSTKKIKPTDIIKFDWDKIENEIKYTKEDEEKIKHELLELAKNSLKAVK